MYRYIYPQAERNTGLSWWQTYNLLFLLALQVHSLSCKSSCMAPSCRGNTCRAKLVLKHTHMHHSRTYRTLKIRWQHVSTFITEFYIKTFSWNKAANKVIKQNNLEAKIIDKSKEKLQSTCQKSSKDKCLLKRQHPRRTVETTCQKSGWDRLFGGVFQSLGATAQKILPLINSTVLLRAKGPGRGPQSLSKFAQTILEINWSYCA